MPLALITIKSIVRANERNKRFTRGAALLNLRGVVHCFNRESLTSFPPKRKHMAMPEKCHAFFRRFLIWSLRFVKEEKSRF